jgi:hypothetical protein
VYSICLYSTILSIHVRKLLERKNYRTNSTNGQLRRSGSEQSDHGFLDCIVLHCIGSHRWESFVEGIVNVPWHSGNIYPITVLFCVLFIECNAIQPNASKQTNKQTTIRVAITHLRDIFARIPSDSNTHTPAPPRRYGVRVFALHYQPTNNKILFHCFDEEEFSLSSLAMSSLRFSSWNSFSISWAR